MLKTYMLYPRLTDGPITGGDLSDDAAYTPLHMHLVFGRDTLGGTVLEGRHFKTDAEAAASLLLYEIARRDVDAPESDILPDGYTVAESKTAFMTSRHTASLVFENTEAVDRLIEQLQVLRTLLAKETT